MITTNKKTFVFLTILVVALLVGAGFYWQAEIKEFLAEQRAKMEPPLIEEPIEQPAEQDLLEEPILEELEEPVDQELPAQEPVEPIQEPIEVEEPRLTLVEIQTRVEEIETIVNRITKDVARLVEARKQEPIAIVEAIEQELPPAQELPAQEQELDEELRELRLKEIQESVTEIAEKIELLSQKVAQKVAERRGNEVKPR